MIGGRVVRPKDIPVPRRFSPGSCGTAWEVRDDDGTPVSGQLSYPAAATRSDALNEAFGRSRAALVHALEN